MIPPRITIEVDGARVEATQGDRLIDVCRAAGIDIPSLCHMKGSAPFSACMLCTVEDVDTGRTRLSCSVNVADGLRIRTRSDAVVDARRAALELLLSEHVGNCEGPCRNGCPAHLNIPRMLTLVSKGDIDKAARLMETEMALPSIVERVCPGLCENTCRRRFHDEAVNIRRLAMLVADYRIEHALPLPALAADSGKEVAIVGAGPAGLSAAWHLRLRGHACTVFDAHDEPGGTLRVALPESKVPRRLLDAECERIRDLGVEFKMSTDIGKDGRVGELKQNFDAIVLAVGKVRPEVPQTFNVESAFNGFRVHPATLQTSDPQVFAIGDAVRARRLAANAVADGMRVAHAVDGFLQGKLAPHAKRFDSKIACPDEADMSVLIQGANPAAPIVPSAADGCYSSHEAAQEAERCMHCECLAAESCALRDYADAYGASQNVYRSRLRIPVKRIRQHADVIFEPGKCVKCGICVRITERAREPLGLTFVDRGYDVRVGVPLNRRLSEGLTETAAACVNACPTAALAFERAERKERSNSHDKPPV